MHGIEQLSQIKGGWSEPGSSLLELEVEDKQEKDGMIYKVMD